MKILPIVKIPNKILRKVSRDVKKEKMDSSDFRELCDNMAFTMVEKDGVGLAAPQVGLNIRLISVNTKDGPIIMINPKIIKKSLLKEWGEEGCLSVPETFGKVKRHKKVKCSYLDINGKKNTISANGLLSVVIQHEVDHLDGVLFIDKAEDVKNIKNF